MYAGDEKRNCAYLSCVYSTPGIFIIKLSTQRHDSADLVSYTHQYL